MLKNQGGGGRREQFSRLNPIHPGRRSRWDGLGGHAAAGSRRTKSAYPPVSGTRCGHAWWPAYPPCPPSAQCVLHRWMGRWAEGRGEASSLSPANVSFVGWMGVSAQCSACTLRATCRFRAAQGWGHSGRFCRVKSSVPLTLTPAFDLHGDDARICLPLVSLTALQGRHQWPGGPGQGQQDKTGRGDGLPLPGHPLEPVMYPSFMCIHSIDDGRNRTMPRAHHRIENCQMPSMWRREMEQWAPVVEW